MSTDHIFCLVLKTVSSGTPENYQKVTADFTVKQLTELVGQRETVVQGVDGVLGIIVCKHKSVSM